MRNFFSLSEVLGVNPDNMEIKENHEMLGNEEITQGIQDLWESDDGTETKTKRETILKCTQKLYLVHIP